MIFITDVNVQEQVLYEQSYLSYKIDNEVISFYETRKKCGLIIFPITLGILWIKKTGIYVKSNI